MPRTLPCVLALGAACGLAALGPAQTANLKDYKLEAKPPADSAKLGQLREGKLKTGGPDLKANRELLRQAAKFNVYKVTDEKYYIPTETGDLRPRDTSNTFDQVLIDVGGLLLQPGPETKYSTAQQEYITVFGAALNEAVRDVLKANPPTPIRVNAGRLLALGAKSGAGAFAGTIHELLTSTFPLDKGKPAKTPPELLLYAIDAAGNLFAAYDPVWHLNTEWWSQYRHGFDNKDQLTLARDLLDLLAKGPGVADLAAPPQPDKPVQRFVRPDGTATDQPPPAAAGQKQPADQRQAKLDAVAVTAEQAHVSQYFRRHVAVAVCKIRADVISEVGQPPVKPGLAIARLAVGDGGIDPPPTTPEVAEAVLGLCYLSPSQTLNVPEVLAAIAAGTQTLVRDFTNRKRPDIARHAQLVPWRLFAERLNAALDHLSRQAASNPRWTAQRAAIGQLATALREDVVVPLRRDDATAQPSDNRLTEFLAARRGAAKADRAVFTDDPASTLTPRGGGR